MTENERKLIDIIRARPDLLEEAIALVVAELRRLAAVPATNETEK